MSSPVASLRVLTLHFIFLFFVFCLTACVGRGVSPAEQPTLIAGGVTYLGRTLSELHVDEYLGLPFAQAPLGDLRWESAKPLLPAQEHIKTVTQATEFAPACLQGPHISNWYKGVIESFDGDPNSFDTPSTSEDCLYLNIWSPSNKPNKALPVMVYFHGGSNRGGWSYEPNYIGANLASRGVVVVSIAYRLGVFGFFSHPMLEQANFALTDQIAALRWVKANIASVGGDPRRITLFGESAGASNIAYLMTIPQSQGLFNRVIHQSAGWAMWSTQTKAAHEPLGLKLTEALTDSRSASIPDLRAISSHKVLAIAEQVYENHFFDVVVDKVTVHKPLKASLDQGDLRKLDLMIGHNVNEARMYLSKDATLRSELHSRLADVDEQLVNNILLNLNDGGDYESIDQLDRVATSYDYACPSIAMAQLSAQAGNNNWFYLFARVRDGKRATEMGAYHGAELPYIFNTHDAWLPTNDEDRKLSNAMAQYWVQFAYSGNPNGSGNLPKWQKYSDADESILKLGNVIESIPHPSKALCRLFNEHTDD